MAASTTNRVVLVLLLLLLCLLDQAFITSALVVEYSGAGSQPATEGSQLYEARHPLAIDCLGLCATRCSKASRAKLCFFDCNACCKVCSCVPSGTAGNREECPCYANLKNSKGTGKCP